MQRTRYVRYDVHTFPSRYMTRFVTATQARKQFFQLLDLAEKPGTAITITREGHQPITMMSTDEFEGWLETLEIMSDPELVAAIKEGTEDMKAGRVIPWSEIKKKRSKKK